MTGKTADLIPQKNPKSTTGVHQPTPGWRLQNAQQQQGLHDRESLLDPESLKIRWERRVLEGCAG
ncbi:MAG: hypothetical protein V4689_05140 [Verrucomicrobiota bacterium]